MKSIKFIFVMAALAATLAFVSCSNEAQDVNVTYIPNEYSHTYYGSVTGEVKFTYTTTDKVSIDTGSSFASVYYRTDDSEKSNARTYDLNVSIKVTDVVGNVNYDGVPVRLKKIGDSYYCNYEKVEVSGSPEDNEFTVTGKIKPRHDSSYEFSTITFTRK